MSDSLTFGAWGSYEPGQPIQSMDLAHATTIARQMTMMVLPVFSEASSKSAWSCVFQVCLLLDAGWMCLNAGLGSFVILKAECVDLCALSSLTCFSMASA
jgi:hypothetical protein